MSLSLDIERHLRAFSLRIAIDAAEGELVALFGHSGSGKSMTLRTIAGLERPDDGRITLGSRAVFDASRGIDVAPHLRNVGLVVQHYALFPHLTARENIEYGLVGWSREARARRVAELTALLSIEGLEARMPHQLSGGQQQRVALARALARPVDALLLDEPFSALDETLRSDLRAELLRLRRELAIPVVFVTHDLREAHLLADRIVVLDEGHVLQFAPREEVFQRPVSRRVAELTGVTNIFEGEADGQGRVIVAGVAFRVDAETSARGPVDLAIRSERCILRRLDPEDELPDNCFVADVVEDLAFGNAHTLRLEPVGLGPAVEVEVASRPYEVLRVALQRRWVVELAPPDLHLMTRP
jgi:molybdate transport system ATP-binding protein